MKPKSTQEDEYSKEPRSIAELEHLREHIASNDPTRAPATLELTEYGLRGVDFRYLSTALAHNTTIKKLNLSKNRLDAEAMGLLGQALAINTTIEELDLSHNVLSASALSLLLHALQKNKTVTTVILHHNPLGDEQVGWVQPLLENTTLEKIDFSYTAIGDRVMMALVPVFIKHPKIKDIALDHNKIGEEGAKAIVKGLLTVPRLTQLNLNHNDLGDAGCTHLAKGLRKNKTLTALAIAHNQISTQGLCWLARLLQHTQTLRIVNINGNTLSTEAMMALADVITETTPLTTLYYTEQSDWEIEARKAHSHIQDIFAQKKDLKKYLQQIEDIYQQWCQATDTDEQQVLLNRIKNIIRHAQTKGHRQVIEQAQQRCQGLQNQSLIDSMQSHQENEVLASSSTAQEGASRQELEQEFTAVWRSIEQLHKTLQHIVHAVEQLEEQFKQQQEEKEVVLSHSSHAQTKTSPSQPAAVKRKGGRFRF